jgi:hypothetical protein
VALQLAELHRLVGYVHSVLPDAQEPVQGALPLHAVRPFRGWPLVTCVHVPAALHTWHESLHAALQQ